MAYLTFFLACSTFMYLEHRHGETRKERKLPKVEWSVSRQFQFGTALVMQPHAIKLTHVIQIRMLVPGLPLRYRSVKAFFYPNFRNTLL